VSTEVAEAVQPQRPLHPPQYKGTFTVFENIKMNIEVDEKHLSNNNAKGAK
jgi:hypothetical protein